MDREKIVPIRQQPGSGCLNDPRLGDLWIEVLPKGDTIEVEAVVRLADGQYRIFRFPWPKRPGSDFSIASILFQKVGRILEECKS